jgi:hypothetical protein
VEKVPPWWLLKKKHAMFYNGFGRGDFGHRFGDALSKTERKAVIEYLKTL